MHSTLHLASALAAIYTGWVAPKELPARIYTWGIGLIYLVLCVVGWFIEGLFLDSHLAVPLGPVDNVFHLGPGVFALAVIGTNAARRPAEMPTA
ncbi:DUF4383 domain-containing protein [Micromonospora kangleipakensis]|uniref:DUF4383 domain-containing protein n=1 Tax=Micromonospora kangleipakensis TaxID=1077942 RepID=UPI0013EF5694|nr:DUF4383 domain-containing protein [Micromonospora kangleipakensis]